MKNVVVLSLVLVGGGCGADEGAPGMRSLLVEPAGLCEYASLETPGSCAPRESWVAAGDADCRTRGKLIADFWPAGAASCGERELAGASYVCCAERPLAADAPASGCELRESTVCETGAASLLHAHDDCAARGEIFSGFDSQGPGSGCEVARARYFCCTEMS